MERAEPIDELFVQQAVLIGVIDMTKAYAAIFRDDVGRATHWSILESVPVEAGSEVVLVQEGSDFQVAAKEVERLIGNNFLKYQHLSRILRR